MRVDVTASSKSISDAIKKIAWYDGKARLGAEKAIRGAVRRMAYRAKARAPRASGALRDSIYSSMNSARLQGEFGAKKPHAHLVEYGTKSYTAEPVKKKALRFVNNDVIRFVRKKVTIPARPARPFFEPAYKQEEPKLLNEIERVLKKP